MTLEQQTQTRMNNFDERAIIERCKRGDRAAFDRLVRTYEKRVYNYSYQLCGNYDDANDISAEAFIRVLKAIRQYRGTANFSTWIFRIATNVYLDRRKRVQYRQYVSLDECMELVEGSLVRQIEDPSSTPYRTAEEHMRRDILQTAIDSLPDSQRAMIVLYHNESMSYQEIAETLAVPVGTVKSRLNRTRLNLRAILSPISDQLDCGLQTARA